MRQVVWSSCGKRRGRERGRGSMIMPTGGDGGMRFLRCRVL